MKSDEIEGHAWRRRFKLAEALGLNGTPSYVVGNDVVIGAAVPELCRALAARKSDGRRARQSSPRWRRPSTFSTVPT